MQDLVHPVLHMQTARDELVGGFAHAQLASDLLSAPFSSTNLARMLNKREALSGILNLVNAGIKIAQQSVSPNFNSCGVAAASCRYQAHRSIQKVSHERLEARKTIQTQGSHILVSSPNMRGIPETMMCRILMFRWSFVPLKSGLPRPRFSKPPHT